MHWVSALGCKYSVRAGEAAIEVGRLVERGLRESAAVDQEALCVLAGRKVCVPPIVSQGHASANRCLTGCPATRLILQLQC